MPGIPLRRGRPDPSEEDGVETEGASTPSRTLSDSNPSPSTATQSGNKRARLDPDRPDTLNVQSSNVPNGVRDATSTDGSRAQGSRLERHQPGSIVRVKLQNFVTYTSAEFFPGPSLNMIIGPNGTGKSTLVCAICLGLGWSPQVCHINVVLSIVGTVTEKLQHLGRAKDVAEYVKHGCHEGMIEIELAKRPKDRGGNPVVRRVIKREGNKSQFYVNGKQAPQKGVLDLARSFSIQIDNLCQFLPQDKVCEFAALSPVELLHSTQRAAAPENMLEWHDSLKQLRSEQKKVQIQQKTDTETLANLDGRQDMLRADVERLQERANIQKRLAMLEKARPFPKYRQARARHHEVKNKSKEAQTDLKKLEDEVEPSLRAVNRKQAYSQQVEKVVKERAKAVDKCEAAADKIVQKQKQLGEQIADLNRETEAEKESDRRRKGEIARLDGNIKRLEKQLAEAPVEFDPLAYNEKIVR